MRRKIIIFDEAPEEKWQKDLWTAAKQHSIAIETCSIKNLF